MRWVWNPSKSLRPVGVLVSSSSSAARLVATSSALMNRFDEGVASHVERIDDVVDACVSREPLQFHRPST